MNPEALQTTTGITYIGRWRTMPSLNNKTETWNTLSNEFISYNNPRLCSAGKLALRGVQIDLIPFNMNLLSSFTTLSRYDFDGASTLNGTTETRGFAPLHFHNPSAIAMQFLVCVEWRVRFDPSNPAQAAHTSHGVSTDSHWGKCIKQLEAGAHGVKDIVETTAAMGHAAYAASEFFAPLLAGA
jgi:hypothetical protein